MSGPKSYEYSYTPPPDMSATYNFSLNSAEEAAGVMAQLSAVGTGVSVSVSGGRITVHVSNSGYNAGFTASVIRSRVDAARAEYQRKLLQRRVREAQTEVNNLKNSIESAARAKQTVLNDAAAQCTALFAELNVSAATPFGHYGMAGEQNEVRQRGMQYKSAADGVEAEKRQCLARCDDYMRRVNAATSAAEVSAIPKLDMRIRESAGKIEAAALCREMREKKDKFERFTSFLSELDRIVKNKGLEEFRTRVTDKVKSVSVYSTTAISEIGALVEQIEGEKRYSLESAKLNRAEAETADKIRAQLGALAEIKQLLAPLEADTQNAAGATLDYTGLCAAALDGCDKIADEIGKRSYLSEPNREAFEKISSTLSAYSKAAASRELYEAVKALKAKADELNKRSEEESEQYDRFAFRVREYTDLYYRFANGNRALENVLATLDDPEEFVFDVSDPEAQLQRLDELNTELKAAADRYDREVLCAAMSERLEKSKFGKLFKKEWLADGTLHLTYVRTDSKGAIYDVVCEEGKMRIYPRGVTLSNGKSTLTAAQLKHLHSTCQWAEEIGQAFGELGIRGGYTELSREECDNTYDVKNYYAIKSREESVRFLRLCGYTQSEIEAFGYRSGAGGREETAGAQTGAEHANAREIKP